MTKGLCISVNSCGRATVDWSSNSTVRSENSPVIEKIVRYFLLFNLHLKKNKKKHNERRRDPGGVRSGCQLTRQCGPIVLDGFRNASKAVECKGNHWDVVTEYDRRVEQVLIGGLSRRFPDHRMLGEESTTEAASKEPLDGRPTWIIDPIDGTNNFVRGVKYIAISVALVVDGRLTVGIVSNPCLDEFYTAVRGQGARLNGEPIRTSGVEEGDPAAHR
ncbi:myo inositol monophosphatase [Culex quinquefasciatus]|uniref:Myo inositol monophosphatase n=1 Tax=Culex quinquefasciatus TaxID=7176 RepID=B0XKR0_CULQU|nr:myo inositol monophosphatase [Culex quinquefasciatus]|eukprot:XP_001870232.1 myo inositol monophosphatase [Culex quinquefasciatus]